MLIKEATWFGAKINSMDPSEIFPMLNIGSSTERFRKVSQPWIDQNIFKPARDRGYSVVHMDLKAAEGVDLIGNLNDQKFQKKLVGMKFKSIFCSNLFEHLTNREDVAKIITSLIAKGGYFFISCPFKYPYHADPIDTGFRPEIDELSELFPGTEIQSSEYVTCGNYKDYITSDLRTFTKTISWLLMPFYKPKLWYSYVQHIPWMFKNFQASCMIIRKV